MAVASSAQEVVRPPHRTIRPPSGWAALNLGEVFAFRDLLISLAARDVKLRYRQTALGVLWVVFQPLIGAGIFTFVFSRVASLGSDGVPYFCFAFAGQIAWSAFATTLTKTSNSLVGNTALVSKVFFPRLVLPLSTVFSTLVDFGVGLVVLTVLMLFQHVVPGWQILTLPVWFALLTLLGAGWGLFASALMVRYRDVQYILPVAVQFLIFASPVGWGMSEMVRRMPLAVQRVYVLVNPLAPLLEALRWSLFGGKGHVPWGGVAYAAAVVVAVILGGMVYFRNAEQRFADVI